MALSDVTAKGVERAIDEFDRLGREAFLAKFGFGKAHGFFLVRGSRRYDSKAVVGVAHGYDRSDIGPLRPQDFSGGEATVARLLKSLGFGVEGPLRSPRWAEEELVLALDLYLRCGAIAADSSEVIELSQVLNDLSIHTERANVERFRNPNGVALKLANFAAIDPNYVGRGMANFAKRDVEVWDKYSSDEDALAATAAGIREGHHPLAQIVQPDGPTSPHVIDVEAQHVEKFRVSVPSKDLEATRGEQRLVLEYANHLRELGHKVTRHRYPINGLGQLLVCDLVDETDHVLYEAKGDVLRTSVRMAIGQLFDYRRFEQHPTRLAVLLPRRPAQDLIDLIHSVPAAVVWRTKDGFADCQP